MTKEAYIKLIEEDLAVLNKHMPESPELDHIKIVLASSIDCYYPNTKEEIVKSHPVTGMFHDAIYEFRLEHKDNPRKAMAALMSTENYDLLLNETGYEFEEVGKSGEKYTMLDGIKIYACYDIPNNVIRIF